jgi:hypothetical protein
MSLVIGQAADPNAGMSERADFFALATVGLDLDTKRFHLLDMLHDRIELTEQPKVVTEQYRKWACPEFYRVGVQTIFYETILFKALLQEGIVPLKEIARRQGKGLGAHTKFTLLTNLQGRYERGQIIHPGSGGKEVNGGRPDTNAAWLPDYEAELLSISFAEGVERHAHDDQAESVALCVEMLATAFLLRPNDEFTVRHIPFTYRG